MTTRHENSCLIGLTLCFSKWERAREFGRKDCGSMAEEALCIRSLSEISFLKYHLQRSQGLYFQSLALDNIPGKGLSS